MARLGGYRGIAQLTGLTLAAEVVDWRRFASARAFMGFAGLIPTEYSSGSRSRRGHITSRPGRGAHRPGRGSMGLPVPAGDRGHAQAPAGGLPPETLARSWKAQQRLNAKYKKMITRGKPPGVAVVAVARELAGFVWAEMIT